MYMYAGRCVREVWWWHRTSHSQRWGFVGKMYERSKLEWRSDDNQTRRVGESMRALSFACTSHAYAKECKSPWWCSITQGLDGGMR